MFALEVLQTCPSQKKALLQSLGAIESVDSYLIGFDLDKSELCLPSSIAFHILVTIHNLNVHRCIIDESTSTCIMSFFVWKKQSSPELTPSTISLKAYDGHPSKPQGLYQNFPMELDEKKVHINIEVNYAPLDYNVLLGHSFMYAMRVIASSVFCLLMFPLDGKVVTIDHLTFYEPHASEALENVLPHIARNTVAALCTHDCPSFFKYDSLLGICEGPAPNTPLDHMYTVSTRPELMTPPDAPSYAASTTP